MIFSTLWNRLRRGTDLFPHSWRVVLLTVALCGFAGAQEEGTALGDFRVPQYDEQGQMTSQLFGEHAEMGSGSLVKIEGVRVEFYRDDEVFMTVESPRCLYDRKSRKVNSEAPVSADMEGFRLTGTGYVLDVDGRTVQVLKESRLVLESMMNGLQEGTGAGDSKAPDVTTITSAKLFLDYFKRTARFVETVRVDNPELGLTCAALNIQFAEKSEIKQIDALDGCILTIEKTEDSAMEENPELELVCQTLQVRFAADNKVDQIDALGGIRLEVFDEIAQTDDSLVAQDSPGTNDTATVITSKELFLDYTGRTGRFENSVHVQDSRMEMDCGTMTVRFGENNQIDWIEALREVSIVSEGREAQAGKAVYDVTTDEFLLEENSKILEGRNILLGDRIRFWRATGRMVCEPSARLIIYPDDKTNTKLFEN